MAARSICAVLLEEEPALLDDVVLGIAACLALDDLAGEWVLQQWRRGSSALVGGPRRAGGSSRAVDVVAS